MSLSRLLLRAPARAHGQTKKATVTTAAALAAAAPPTAVPGWFSAAAVISRGVRKTAATTAAHRTAGATCGTPACARSTAGGRGAPGRRAACGAAAADVSARLRDAWGGGSKGKGATSLPAAATATVAVCRRVVAVMGFPRAAFTAAAAAGIETWLPRPCRSAVAGSCYVSRAASTALLRRAEVAARQGGGLRNSSSVSDPSCSKFTHVAALPRQHPQNLLPTKQQQRLLRGQPQLPHLHGWGQLQVSLRRQTELLPFAYLSFLPRAGELRSSCLGGSPQAGPQQQRVYRQQVPQHHREQPRTSPGAQGRRSVRFVLPRRGQTQQQLILPPRNSLDSVRGRLFASSSSSSQSPGRDSSGSSEAAGSSAAALTAEPFLTGTNAAYVEQMFAAWRRDPTSVHASWAAYFSNVQRGLSPAACFSLPPSSCTAGASTGAAPAGGAPARSAAGGTAAAGMWCPYVASAPGSLPAGSSFVSPDVVGEGTAASPQSVQDTSRLIQMVRGYQLRGHECAAVNPLELPRTLPFVSVPHSRSAAAAAKLDYTTYGFTAADLDRVFDYRVPGMEGFLSADRPPQTLGRLVQRLEEAYCGSIGVEYMHINDREVCNFIRKHIETPEKYAFPAAVQQKILARTARAQLFENFCGQRFSTSKRFGLDGCETMIVGLKALTKKAAREGVKSVVIGMPHRGRLNVLVNILHKPMQQLLSEFLGVTKYSLAEWGNSGDVKYHLGVEFDHFDADAQRYIHMGVLPNPSHLEAVDPLVIGQARAQQYYSGDRDCSAVLPVLLHGDASIAGQGVVYETLQMSQLPFYRVGGAIHIVVNNQIGFTTNPVDSCSGRYCTDVAKAFDAPIFHVNADDPEAVTFVSELAFKYRQHFKGDVFIDLIGYRRLGHNELDMPKFTQPAMYTVISQKKPVFDLYAEKLRQQGVVQEADLQKLKESISTFYNAEYEKCKTYLPTQNYEYSPQWKHLVRPDIAAAPRLTGVRVDRLRELGTRLYTLPPNFSVHPTVGKIFKERLHAVQANIDEKVIDFGTAETLCYATLLSDGFHVRVAGQDVQRGTFSHRHAVLHDQTTFEPYCIYHSLRGYNFPHEILFANSLLSEYAAMGYEFGYSLEHPDSLCVWEAQFGDFSNGAQIIIDQFVASGEVKWNKQSGIVLMLPHGYDGQGPEHSSGRIERLLQLCDDREDVIHKENWEIERSSVIQQHNLQVIMPSTPANMFHALRRQVHREFRKPLVIFSPKRMLKMRAAMCALRQLDEGTRFRRYIPDKTAVPEKVRRLIVCSGQVYYDIIAAREKRKASEGEAEGPGDQIAVARMEQLSPFPFDLFIKDLQQYPNLQTVVWAQEEPMNQGAWFYTSKRIENSLSQIGFPNGIRAPVYAGRDVNATTAVGDKRLHDQEVTQLLEDALDLGRVTHSYLEKYIHKQKEKEGQGNSQEGHAQAAE